MPYIPHTKDDIREMLQIIGKGSVEDLFTSIPSKYRLKQGALKLHDGMSEYQARERVQNLADVNKVYPVSRSFLGAGAYYHFIPAAVNHIVSRSEFYTAYTPYQPEISQGTLQAIFEFQTMMCRLTGLDVSNASMYDGATAFAEAVLVAYHYRREKKNRVIIPKNIHPDYIAVLKNYMEPFGIELVTAGCDDKTSQLNTELLKEQINGALAVCIQSPNFFGVIESNAAEITKMAKEAEAVSIFICAEPTSLGMFKSPGELGFDIAVVEIQALGNPVAFGGPYAGVIVAKNEFVRNMPGRIIGETKDVDGKKAYVLTLATREQHIRREKATSNICSNQALVALRTSVYLSLIGEDGFKELARTNYANSHYARELAAKIPSLTVKYSGVFYNEFLVEFKSKDARDKSCDALKKEDFLPGYKLGDNKLLITVTEVNDKNSIDKYFEVLRRHAA
ncbi:MAG: aminomethyl-transferring glycine dehydrogenase subunit GcvPA [Pseudomonadota bacterium]